MGRQVRNNLSRAGSFVGCSSWPADKNFPAARRVFGLFGVEWAFNSNCPHMRKIGEARRGSRLHRIAHEMLIQIEDWSEVRLKEGNAQLMQAGLGRNSN